MAPMNRNREAPTPRQLRKLREASGLSQTLAAHSVFVSLRTWQNWESGKHEMRPMLWHCFQQHVESIRAEVSK